MRLLSSSDADISLAASALKEGRLVAFPTETVYGLGGDAFNTNALARIFEAKKRPRFDPLIIHIAGINDLDRIADLELLDPSIRNKLDLLCEKLWPGPLTLILPKRLEVPGLATSGLPTAAIRFPNHPVAQKLIRLSTGAVAAPSANPFGCLSPTRAEHVRDQLGGEVDFIIDGGKTSVGVESTVLDITALPARILRPGGCSRESIEAVIGHVETGANPAAEAAPSGANLSANVLSPGQLKSHYAPRTPLVLHPLGGLDELPAGQNEGRLYFKTPDSGISSKSATEKTRVLSKTGNLIEAAANLFDMLHELDSLGLDVIHAEETPMEGLGAAINDRLRRAAAKTGEVYK
ncbi:L-threonylcarbamoyladenylate synthase [Leadbettera azotonutricia]|uniref:Threonylcarbamoyl-AMP synthase n=1 Tax=Leadbettera azotonutricia (strain ATCC BAA-888 / DSM 13862 / ZAS-9) TaxID=545695 RepID=F5YB50_LEAAZ|nr:L-threonylcarbamoyladenylate synthase [Leadbettera azotonutricia]AEF81018.1 Sua5/YciO/YrdC/YwlC [Leadbettera azotonutricia ZAS-9]